MANKNLFKSIVGKILPATDTVNAEGAKAYRFDATHALAQYAATGCFNSTFYASAEEQLETVLDLCKQVDPAFVGKVAVYCRKTGYMKDMPALLCAWLSVHDQQVLAAVFPKVIDTPKMLRNFVQIMRSGVVGRKSLGSMPRRLVRNWLAAHNDEQLFCGSVGKNPSLADVIKMVHPKPHSTRRAALLGYLIGRPVNAEALPELVRSFEAYKAGHTNKVPKVPFQMLSALNLGRREWTEIARNAPWQMTRMNLNTFARHGVFEDREVTALIARRLRDKALIEKARVFPYQLMAAYGMTGASVPNEVREALQDAMEIAMANVPAIDGMVYVCPDVSGSMTWSAVTGHRQGATSKVRCIDVAALFAAAVLRKNPQAYVIPFEHDVVDLQLNPRDSVMTNAGRLASIGGGGTNCSAPLALLNKQQAFGDVVIFISDNESWVDAQSGRGTEMLRQWNAFKKLRPHAKLVCIDIQPGRTTQAIEREDILNVGGFSDRVFELVANFAAGTLHSEHWIGEIERYAAAHHAA